MGSPNAKRRLVVYITLIGCGLAVCGWQVEEHRRFTRNAAGALINRGRDITSTLGVFVRSQRRFGIVSKERLQSALQDLVRPDDLESIAILAATGEPIASAGTPVDLTPDMLQAKGVYWRERTLTIMNVMDLGAAADEAHPRPPILIADDRTARAFRPPSNRRSSDTRAATEAAATPPVAGNPGAPGSAQSARPAFGRPPWMSKEEYDAVIQKQGVHSLVLSISTLDMHRAINADLLLRSLVSLLAMGGAIVSALALRNVGKNAELQIRLVRAGEMNAHLKEMNLTAAGLAHETRNPLNLIRGLAQMIAMEAPDAPKLKEHASIILEEADRVTVQLNEFINYSKPRDAHLAPVDLKRLVADVARTLLPDLDEKHITLRESDTPLAIEADEQLLRQTLFNILLNAVQAVGPGGHIEVRWSHDGPRQAKLEICDDGPGVPAADRTSIFKPYVTMRPKGVGLGLAIAAQIAVLHHWEISCEANEPRGARFIISRIKLAASPA